MQQSDAVHKVEPCDICGDVGFAEVNVTCSKCKLTHEHIYCMRINLMEVPDDWLCEACQSKNATTSPCKVNQDFGLQTSKRQQSFKTGRVGKVKYLHEDEVIKLSSFNFSTKPSQACSSLPMIRKAIPGSSTLPLSRRASKSVIPKIPTMTLKPNPCIASMEHRKFPRSGVHKDPITDQHASSSKGPRKEHRLVSEGRVGAPIPNRRVQTLNLLTEKPTKGALCKDLLERKSLPVAVSGAVAECNKINLEKSNIQSIHENFHHDYKYLPSSVSAWSGQFQILQAALSGEFYDGFEAQPPCIIHRKAYELSNKMPSVLQLESLPALNGLADAFQDCSPSLQDIALYFFPSDNSERSRKNLNSLFKFMNAENSMLRSFIDGVELLVFTSHQLNEDSRGIIAAVNEGYFLWGVFRSKKASIANERFTDMEPVDMDIDMMGGNDVVGRIDHVLNDNSSNLSQLPLEGTPLPSTTFKRVEERTLIPSSNLNLYRGDKSILSENLDKKIKSEHSSDPSSWSPIKKYHKMLDILDAPPGFEAHGKNFSS